MLAPGTCTKICIICTLKLRVNNPPDPGPQVKETASISEVQLVSCALMSPLAADWRPSNGETLYK